MMLLILLMLMQRRRYAPLDSADARARRALLSDVLRPGASVGEGNAEDAVRRPEACPGCPALLFDEHAISLRQLLFRAEPIFFQSRHYADILFTLCLYAARYILF